MAGHQIIKTPGGEELVLLSRAEYEALIRAAGEVDEDAADVAAYDRAKSDLAGSAPLPVEVSASILGGNSVIKAWRKYRKMSQIELAEAAGLSQGFLSDLENGRRAVTATTAEKLAKALDVDPAWLFETTEIAR